MSEKNKEHASFGLLLEVFKNSFVVPLVGLQMAGLICFGLIETVFSTISSRIFVIHFTVQAAGYLIALLPLFFCMVTVSYCFQEMLINNNTSINLYTAIDRCMGKIAAMLKMALIFIGVVIAYVIVLSLCNALIRIPYAGDFLWPLVFFPNLLTALIIIMLIPFILLSVHVMPPLFAAREINTLNLKLIRSAYWYIIQQRRRTVFISTVIGASIFFIHYCASLLHLLISHAFIGEKSIHLLIEIPRFPGYVLRPWLKYYLPFDFIHTSNFFQSIGAFFWSLLMFLTVCFVYASILTFWNAVGICCLDTKNTEQA
ncbi:MAG: hypothetical protein AB1454_10530 [Candidatus Auribacterota bacterium]